MGRDFRPMIWKSQFMVHNRNVALFLTGVWHMHNSLSTNILFMWVHVLYTLSWVSRVILGDTAETIQCCLVGTLKTNKFWRTKTYVHQWSQVSLTSCIQGSPAWGNFLPAENKSTRGKCIYKESLNDYALSQEPEHHNQNGQLNSFCHSYYYKATSLRRLSGGIFYKEPYSSSKKLSLVNPEIPMPSFMVLRNCQGITCIELSATATLTILQF